MKSEIIQDKPEDTVIEYPCLMQGIDGFVVLFAAKSVGIVVKENKNYNIGFYSEGWFMSHFKPFKGKLVLSND